MCDVLRHKCVVIYYRAHKMIATTHKNQQTIAVCISIDESYEQCWVKEAIHKEY